MLPTIQFHENQVIGHRSSSIHHAPWKDFRVKIRMGYSVLWENWQTGPQIAEYFQKKVFMNLDVSHT